MQEGKIRLFRNTDRVNCCNIRKGDKGIELEELLPPSMRKTAFEQAPAGAFFQRAYHFLATNEQWDEFWRDMEPGIKTTKKPPFLDIEALKLDDENGQVDYERLRDLYSLIWPYWDKQPAIGLIAHCITKNVSHEQIARLLELYDRYGDVIKDLDGCFVNLFIPPDRADQGHIVSEKQLLYGFRWCRHPDDSAELKQDSFKWQLNLRELGILNSLGMTDAYIAKLAREFIWADPTREPDFFALKKHLAPHLPTAERPAAKAPNKQLPKAFQDKLKKQIRKAGRVRRKR